MTEEFFAMKLNNNRFITLAMMVAMCLSSFTFALSAPVFDEGMFAPGQIASRSVSPVRMRTACSIGLTKTLPSPICPVLAEAMMAAITLGT